MSLLEDSLRIKLGRLVELRQRAENGVYFERGLCARLNIGSLFEFCQDNLGCPLTEWPLYSGNPSYPVPHPSDVRETKNGLVFWPRNTSSAISAAEYAYQHGGWNKYSLKSTYGRTRWELAEWVKDKIRQKLESLDEER
ncbi:MAG: hypothetical protein B7X50_07980 [Alishewanella sp. 34-51-39]|nr:MAG: hypothetical protein B7X50_07980 [Alishewanella sp. 34-51-39]